MWDLFGTEFPESLKNTVKIAEMCAFDLPQGDDVRQLPNFPIPVDSGHKTVDGYFEKVLWDGFEDRKRTEWDPMIELSTLRHDLDEYRERLGVEIATIKEMGFPGYFLIVWDFIAYAREQKIPVGPGAARRRAHWLHIACGSRTLTRCNMSCFSSVF